MPEPSTEPWSLKSAAQVDNYAEFIGRLDAASAKLIVQRDTLNKTLKF